MSMYFLFIYVSVRATYTALASDSAPVSSRMFWLLANVKDVKVLLELMGESCETLSTAVLFRWSCWLNPS